MFIYVYLVSCLKQKLSSFIIYINFLESVIYSDVVEENSIESCHDTDLTGSSRRLLTNSPVTTFGTSVACV